MENYHAIVHSALALKTGFQSFSGLLPYWLNTCGHFDIPAMNNTSDF
jgi:hypothetical protein